ncbi:hypothetical protein N7U66_15750 [Lacinutrix neustonica]|uniref:Uncharacterized protein n=1 Tax=Lacinutrix neustonica TaxID=2980107 RepID=A0A9E8SDQ3_9FLAO|nr:hypothetical protein [Lacinutrix neustonica]WAC01459.1 hypothetical protein N7U66_15750 [Lacinutrix neustonica]
MNYNVTTGKPYIIDSISTKISTTIIDSLYKLSANKSFIELNRQYKSVDAVNERERITDHMRNSGVYHFSQDHIYLEYDTIGKTKKVKLEIQISDRQIRFEDTTLTEPFKIYKVKEVNIFTDSRL